MKILFPILLAAGLALPAIAASPRIAIVKADDVRGPNPKWDRCFEIAIEKDIKVSAGIIANSIEKRGTKYADWLKKWDTSGNVEF